MAQSRFSVALPPSSSSSPLRFSHFTRRWIKNALDTLKSSACSNTFYLFLCSFHLSSILAPSAPWDAFSLTYDPHVCVCCLWCVLILSILAWIVDHDVYCILLEIRPISLSHWFFSVMHLVVEEQGRISSGSSRGGDGGDKYNSNGAKANNKAKPFGRLNALCPFVVVECVHKGSRRTIINMQ